MSVKAQEVSFVDLPKRASEYTEEQQQRVVAYLARMSLTQLRKRQGVIESQIAFTHRRLGATKHKPEKQKLTETLTDLRAMFDMETAAVSRREFGS